MSIMRARWSLGALALAGAFSLIFVDPGAAQAQLPATTTQDGVSGDDALRTGGCTGCFITQMTAAISQFSDIKRVFRTCGAGGAFPATGGDQCALNGTDASNPDGGELTDFVLIQGDLKDSNSDAFGLGVPGGETNAVYRISANGSGSGFACSAASGPTGIGFIAPEGFDGLPNTADDAGGTGTFGAVGNGDDDGNGDNDGVAEFGENFNSAPLTNCVGTLAQFGIADADIGEQRCIVNYDNNGDGDIDNERVGFPVAANPNAHLLDAGAGNETSNLRLPCDLGFGDLPPSDFLPARPPIADQQTHGAQLFKIIASKDVHAVTGLGATPATDTKLHLNDPQIEGIFSPPGITSVCSLSQLGAASTAGAGVPQRDLYVCLRASGSGTRETFRGTWLANKQGDTPHAAGQENPQDPPDFVDCGGGAGFRKAVEQHGSGGAVADCVNDDTHAIGYVDVGRTDSNFYGVVVEGIDPDNNDMKLLAACGLNRYWGPLSGGQGDRAPGSGTLTDFEVAHRFALEAGAVFDGSVISDNPGYVPASEVYFDKNATDGNYFLPSQVFGGCPGIAQPPIPISSVP